MANTVVRCRTPASPEIREIGYPVWAVGVCPRRSRNEFTFGSIGEPITISGVEITRDDWIVADESGVLRVPGKDVQRVLDYATRVAAQEKELIGMVKNDRVTSWDHLAQVGLVERLSHFFDEDAVIELIGLTAFQILSSKFNSALDVPAQGFCRWPKT